MIKTLSFKLYNNDKYLKQFDTHVGICRYIFNAAKETKDNALKEGVILSGYDLSKQLTECKKEFPWLKQVHSQTLQAVIERLDISYQNYFRKLKNGEILKAKNSYIKKRTSKELPVCNKKLFNLGKPKWAKKNEYNSMLFKSLKIGKNGFILPKFGYVKVFNFEYFMKQKCNIKTATLIKKAGNLYLNVVIELNDIIKNQDEKICSIDMGITHYLVTSNKEFVANPKHLFKAQANLKIAQRKLSRKYKSGIKIQSKNYYKQVNVVAKLYKKVTDIRLDFIHKLTTNLANKYTTIVVEDLNIQGMVRNTKLAKHILDCAWGKFFEILATKTNVVKVNPAYTSQQCSKCGHTCKENRPTQSLFECIKCGHTDNADYQATQNLLIRYEARTLAIEVKVEH
jgi:putative transposase